MANLYFIFKFIIELLPVVLFGLLTITIITINVINQYRFTKKINYLKSIGFERYLKDVASVSNKAWYGWEREDGSMFGQRISEEEINRIDYKELKEKFPN